MLQGVFPLSSGGSAAPGSRPAPRGRSRQGSLGSEQVDLGERPELWVGLHERIDALGFYPALWSQEHNIVISGP